MELKDPQNINAANLPIGVIKAKEGFNPRKYFDPSEHAELVESVKENGIIQPIMVRPASDGSGGYWVVCGERRFRAAKEAGLAHIPVVVREIGDAEAMVVAIIENAQRANITPAEEAQSARKVLTGCGNDRQEAMRLLGWSQSKFDSRMLLLHADQAVLDALAERKIKLGHAELLSQLPSEFQVNTLTKIISDGYTVGDLKAKLAGFSMALSKACFDKAECQNCPHNSALQASLFDDHIDGGKCANHDCFTAKTDAAMLAKKGGLAEQYAVVFLDTERTKDSYTVICQQGENGVGKTQFERGCRQCAHFGALLNTSPDKIGKVTEDCCFNLDCHKGKVASYQDSLKPGLVAASLSAAATQSVAGKVAGGQDTTGKKKPAKAETAGAATIPGKVTEAIETFYRQLAAKSAIDDPRMKLCLNTFGLVQLVCVGVDDTLLPEPLRGGSLRTAGLSRFLEKLAGIGTEDIQAFNDRLVQHLLSNHDNKMPDSNRAWAAGAGTVVKQLGIALKHHFVVDKAFLSGFTKAGLESILQETVNGNGVAFVPHYEAHAEGNKFTSLLKKKNTEIIDAVFGCGYDFTGFVPACVLKVMGDDNSEGQAQPPQAAVTQAIAEVIINAGQGDGTDNNGPASSFTENSVDDDEFDGLGHRRLSTTGTYFDDDND
ncbi:MAG: PRTRC system ParB family protein [Methyloglobulus sp.]|nr:PRTRC system ParB family protein [Methyloglobulus sp.]